MSYLKDEKFVNTLNGNVPDLVMWPNRNRKKIKKIKKRYEL